MIDFHSHILPGLDDGAVTVDDSIFMAKALVDFGYKTVYCTPHCIKGYYDLTPQKVREATLMLQADLDNAEIPLALKPGMEYMLDECFSQYADDLMPLDDTRLVLCEAPPQAHPGIVQNNLERILEEGYVPLIAHPERTPYFYDMLMRREASKAKHDDHQDVIAHDMTSEVEPSKVPKKSLFGALASRLTLKKTSTHGSLPNQSAMFFSPKPKLPEGVLFHANLGSFSGFYGDTVQRKAYALLKLGIYTALASDLHDGGSATKVLVQDKIENNPLIKSLADFDGSLPEKAANASVAVQEELFK